MLFRILAYCLMSNHYHLILQNSLEVAIIYVLLNPVHARLVSNPYAYHWSSVNCYFSDEDSDIVDGGFVFVFLRKRILS